MASPPSSSAVNAVKCEHGRRKRACKECGGKGICEHGRRKYECKDCGGGSYCEHGRRKQLCKECGGSSICEHDRQRAQCKECGGSSICEHDRQRAQCKECEGSSLCALGKRKGGHEEHGGSQACAHGGRVPPPPAAKKQRPDSSETKLAIPDKTKFTIPEQASAVHLYLDLQTNVLMPTKAAMYEVFAQQWVALGHSSTERTTQKIPSRPSVLRWTKVAAAILRANKALQGTAQSGRCHLGPLAVGGGGAVAGFCLICGQEGASVMCSGEGCFAMCHAATCSPCARQAATWTCFVCSFGERAARRKEAHGTGAASVDAEAYPCEPCGEFSDERRGCSSCGTVFCMICAQTPVWDALSDPKKGCFLCAGSVLYDRRVEDRFRNSKKLEPNAFANLVASCPDTCLWRSPRNQQKAVVQVKKDVLKAISGGKAPPLSAFDSLSVFPTDGKLIRDIAGAHAMVGVDRAAHEERWGAEWRRQAAKELLERLGIAAGADVLHLAFVSDDWRGHPTSDLFIATLHNLKRLGHKITIISLCKDDGSDMRRKVVEAVDRVINIDVERATGEGGAAYLEETIGRDFHCLVDMSGHTAGGIMGYLFSLQLSPIQVMLLAYPGTSGSEFIQYIVTDSIVCPDEHAAFYSEKRLLVSCCQANSHKLSYPDILEGPPPQRADHGLEDCAFVFCNPGRLGRICPELFQAWVSILHEVEGSVLWLYPSSAVPRMRLLAAFEKAGVDTKRVIFMPNIPKREHLRRLTLADCYLDTLAYNGHTTGTDMLWANVLMVTCPKEMWPSRVGASLANALDMTEEMVAKDLEDYKMRAVRLAKDKAYFDKARAKLTVRRLEKGRLFDNEAWTRELAEGLKKAWEELVNPEAGTCWQSV